MRFSAFKEFKEGQRGTLEQVARYLGGELASVLRELRTGLPKLSFADNFESFELALTIPTSTELQIRNVGSFIPSKWIKTDTDEGGLYVCKGDTPWTQDWLYLKNTSATLVASLSVTFLR